MCWLFSASNLVVNCYSSFELVLLLLACYIRLPAHHSKTVLIYTQRLQAHHWHFIMHHNFPGLIKNEMAEECLMTVPESIQIYFEDCCQKLLLKSFKDCKVSSRFKLQIWPLFWCDTFLMCSWRMSFSGQEQDWICLYPGCQNVYPSKISIWRSLPLKLLLGWEFCWIMWKCFGNVWSLLGEWALQIVNRFASFSFFHKTESEHKKFCIQEASCVFCESYRKQFCLCPKLVVFEMDNFVISDHLRKDL